MTEYEIELRLDRKCSIEKMEKLLNELSVKLNTDYGNEEQITYYAGGTITINDASIEQVESLLMILVFESPNEVWIHSVITSDKVWYPSKDEYAKFISTNIIDKFKKKFEQD